MLEIRDLGLTVEQRQRIEDCDDLDQLKAWRRKAVTVTSAEAFFSTIRRLSIEGEHQ